VVSVVSVLGGPTSRKTHPPHAAMPPCRHMHTCASMDVYLAHTMLVLCLGCLVCVCVLGVFVKRPSRRR
jgi:hypothetical protein